MDELELDLMPGWILKKVFRETDGRPFRCYQVENHKLNVIIEGSRRFIIQEMNSIQGSARL